MSGQGDREEVDVELTWHQVGDVAQPVVSLGAPSGHPVLLLAGLSDGLAPLTDPDARAQMASPPLDLLDEFHVHVASHRVPMPAEPTTAQLARDAAALLQRLAERPATLVGHSMGAMVAQHLAAQRPDLVARMVLSCTVARADDTFRAALTAWAEPVRDGRWRDVYVGAIDRSYTGSAWLSRRVAQRVLPLKRPSPELAARHLALTHACATHDALDRLAGVEVPVLVLAGARDQVTAPHHAHQLAAALPNATLEVWDGVGHGLPEQAASRFDRRVRRFLDATAGATHP